MLTNIGDFMKKINVMAGIMFTLIIGTSQAAILECRINQSGPETKFQLIESMKTAQVVDGMAKMDLVTTKAGRTVDVIYLADSGLTSTPITLITSKSVADEFSSVGTDTAYLNIREYAQEETFLIKCQAKN